MGGLKELKEIEKLSLILKNNQHITGTQNFIGK